MNRVCKLRLVLFAVLALSSMRAQIKDNRLMPPVIDLTRIGWDVTTQSGNLTLAIPMAMVPGEIPIPVAFGMNATYTVTNFEGPMTTYKGPGPVPPPLGTSYEVIRPAVGGVHFGYITTAVTYGSTPKFSSTAKSEGLTVLEAGQQIYDSQWTSFSSHSELGTTLNLPQAYGFTSVSTTTAMVDPSATYLSYSTSMAGLGTTYQNIVQNLPLNGFGNTGGSYKVVLDKNRARVFAFATSIKTWVPVLWADRFGHYVTFQWVRSTSGLPTGVTAITSVTAINQRSKGVNVRWANYALLTSSEQDILTIDYIGLSAPSVIVRGLPEAGAAPSGFVDPWGVQNYDVPGRIYPYPSQFTVAPSIGLVCRPTSIQVGSPGAIPLPSWNGSSGAAAPIANRGMSYSSDGTTASDLQMWSFSYDAAKAELSSFTDPRGLTTTFTYSNYSAIRGVSRVDCVDAGGNKNAMRWTRTFPVGSNPLTVKLEGWWNPDILVEPNRYRLLTFSTDALNFGLGVYQTDALIDTTGKTWSNTYYYLSPVGAGLNLGLSSIQSIDTTQVGAPKITTTYGTPTSSRLQVTQVNVTASDESGKAYRVSSTANTYESRWDMLEGHQLTKSVTTRYMPNGSTALPDVTQQYVWDAPTTGLPVLQLQKSYLDGGTAGRHGSAYAYDGQGRISTVNVYHVEGTTEVTSPNTQAMGYDSGSGMQASVVTTDNNASPQTAISQTQGGFDSWGRARSQTDAAGVTTTFAFDDRGRVTAKSRPGSPSVSYAYPDELTTKVTVNGVSTTYVYDGFHRLQSLTKPTGSGTSIVQKPTYDVYGRLVSLRESTTAGSTRNETWAYDALDRPRGHAPVAGSATETTYTVSGINSQVTTTLSNGTATSILKDPLGQTVLVTTPDGTQSTSTYDQFGNQTNLSMLPSVGQSQSRSWTYDALGRLTSKWEPETNTQLYQSFNALNQPTSITEAYATNDARSRNLTFDGFGRVLAMVNPQASVVNSYSGVNLVSSSRNVQGEGTVQQTFSYAGVGGRLSLESTIQPGITTTIGYSYDASLGNLTTLTYPGGRVVGYEYDALGRVNSISNNGTPLVSNVTFDEWGNRYQTQFASGSLDQWEGDQTGTRLKSWNIGYIGGGPDGHSYTYDNATNILKSTGDWSLEHDTMGRLTVAEGFGIKTSHNYDAFGNATFHQATSNGSAVPATFNNFTFNPMANNQIPGLESNGALTGWNTNLRGEATQVGTATSSGIALGLGWDALGSLSSVVWNGGNQRFLYAPSGTRVSLTDSITSANNRKYAYAASGLLLGELGTNSGGTGVTSSTNAGGGDNGPTATTYRGNKAVRIWHKQGTNCSLGRPLGNFATGDVVTVRVWVMAAPGAHGMIFLGDAGGNDPYDNYEQTSLVGNGQWQCMTLTHTMTHADIMNVYLYGDRDGTTNNAVSVIYDDVSAASDMQGVVLNEGFESGLDSWPYIAGQLNEIVSSPTATTYNGSKALRIWHKQGTNCSLARSLGVFASGDVVTAKVWFKAESSVYGQMFLGNSLGTPAYDNMEQTAVVGNGQWQSITLTHTMTHADQMAVFIYGDRDGTTSNDVSVIYDDVSVASNLQGLVLNEGFASGFDSWSGSGQPNDLVTSNSSWRDVVYLGSQAIAEIDANGVHELHSDHLGSPRLITRGNGTWDADLIGTVEATQAYGPYGELLPRTLSYVPLTGYTGHIQTDASGLIYMRGRYYSPAWHAFVNSDQGLDPNSWNQRAYGGGSPFMGTDPSGMAYEMVYREGSQCYFIAWVNGGPIDRGRDGKGWVKVRIPCPPDATGSGLDDNQNSWGSGNQGSPSTSMGGSGPRQTPQKPPCDKSGVTFGITFGAVIEVGDGSNGAAIGGSFGGVIHGEGLLADSGDLAGQMNTNLGWIGDNSKSVVKGGAFSKFGPGLTWSGNHQQTGVSQGMQKSWTIGVVNFTKSSYTDGTTSSSLSLAFGLSYSKTPIISSSASTNYGNRGCR